MKRNLINYLAITSIVTTQAITSNAQVVQAYDQVSEDNVSIEQINIDKEIEDNKVQATDKDLLKPEVSYIEEVLEEQNSKVGTPNCTCGEYHLEVPSLYSATRSTPVINGIRVDKQLIDINYSKGETIVPKYIVIHDTDNRAKGADAMANRNYFANHPDAKASAHYLVDDSNIVQALEDRWKGWHVGDGNHPNINNSTTIGIELCVNSGNDFDKTVENGIALTKYLMQKYNIPAENVVRHKEASGKICPRMMIEDRPQLWSYFKEKISGFSGSGDSGNDNGNSSSGQEVESGAKPTSTGTVVDVSSSLNVRQSANSSSTVVHKFQPNQSVSIYGESNGFYKTHYTDGNTKKYGYASKQYISVGGNNPPDSSTSGSKKGIVSVDTYLNVRSGAGTQYEKIASLTKGKQVDILGESGSWYKIKFDGKVGYASKEYIKLQGESNESTSTKKGVVSVNSSLNVRSGAGTQYSVVGSLANGKSVDILGESGSWYKIKFDGKTGYVLKEYIKTQTTGGSSNTSTSEKSAVVKVSSGLNVRSGPGSNYNIIASLYNNKNVTVIGESGSWYKIRFDGKVGYASKSYIEIKGSSNSSNETGVVVNVDNSLNVRKGPGTDYEVIGYLKANAKVQIKSKQNDWYNIIIDTSSGKKEGFVHSKYIKIQ